MTSKRRLSATVDPDLLDAAQEAVDAGRAPNVSAWVNEALRRHVEHERRIAALGAFIEHYEAEHGVITDDETAAAARRAREKAVVVRGVRKRAKKSA